MKDSFSLYISFLIILTLLLSFIWDFTWVSVPSAMSFGSLWVVVTKVSLFRCLLHINVTRKVVTMHLMRRQQLFLRSFGLSHLHFKSIGHVLLSRASWKVPLAVGMQIWGFHPRTPLHVLLICRNLRWAFIMHWQSPWTVYCPQTSPWPNILIWAYTRTGLVQF